MSLNFNNIVFETSFGNKNQLLKSDCLEFVFSGRSNVGKSSLINKLFNRKHLARVSSTPGKTATINFYKLNNLRFVDLPGYGFAKVSKTEKNRWKELISSYLWSYRNIALIFQLVDIRHRPSKEDIDIINSFIDSETPFVVVLTKADKLTNNQTKKRLEEITKEIPCGDQIKLILFSSVTGEGVEEIREIINQISQV
ncbi:MAG: YihA family ribosome biogenesis GTP-binding protein [Oscillospiraceae bacterium]|nr:YihA family ribosome biogenesis GTP-binding protein [Oscillospiraceae bacterium]